MKRKLVHRQSAGFSLIELMVGMVIALIGVLVIFQVFAVSEKYKRTSTSGSDAQQNGSIGLFTIERDLRMAGYGLADTTLLGCTVRAYNETRTPQDFTFTFRPLFITQGAGNNATTGVGQASDSIEVSYGNSGMGMAYVDLTQNMPSPSSVYKVSNRFGFREGDLIIVAEAGKDCTLAEVTGLPGTPGQTDNAIHNSGNYTNASGANVPANYNKPAGLGISYTTNARVYNLGSLPTTNIYSIQNNSLAVNSTFTGTTLDIADNIVNIQAVYCKDTINTPPAAIDTCDAVAPASYDRVLAVQVGIVARSAKPERECNVTANSNIPWIGGVFDLSADPNWQCYRYKVFQTTVPLRNMIWRP